MKLAALKEAINPVTQCTTLENTLEAQILLEEEYSERSLLQGMVIHKYSRENQHSADNAGFVAVFRAAFGAALPVVELRLAERQRGLAGKYLGLIRHLDPEKLTAIAVRTMLNAALDLNRMTYQNIADIVGKCVEAEACISFTNKLHKAYMSATLNRMERTEIHDETRRWKLIVNTAESLPRIGIEVGWQRWKAEERFGVAKILIEAVFEATQLFRWEATGKKGMFELLPAEALQDHADKLAEQVIPSLTYPVMLIEPRPWMSMHDGGYYTAWWQHHAPMCTLRNIPQKERTWVLEGLSAAWAEPVRNAMNKLQSVPYRICQSVYDTLQAAVATRMDILGLPRTAPEPRPEFPFDEVTFDKTNLNAQEAACFAKWRRLMQDWYSGEEIRKTRCITLLQAVKAMLRFRDIPRFYFPTFIDWRGRIYYRGLWNPQSPDAIRGCLEFAEGKPLGKRGLYWLKVHIANCCGYDKAHPDLKVQYVEENHDVLMHFLEDPLNVTPPDTDTCWQLLQALTAYRDALASGDPASYVCHVPIAMDATCSGLQHLSAMLRDAHGGRFVNLLPVNAAEKQDIYTEVAKVAQEVLPSLGDDVQQLYWKDKSITRSMAKRPVMTYVYGSTLNSTMDYVCEAMQDAGMQPIKEVREDGTEEVLVSVPKLCVPVAKALRIGVVKTVPKASEAMQYLQQCCKVYSGVLRWITPAGMPVVNWSEQVIRKRLRLDSMGISCITIRKRTGELDVQKAINSVVPNFVHSMDAAHLCLVLQRFKGQMMAVHDSFATHSCDVDDMHEVIRKAFVNLYSKEDVLGLIGKFNPDVAHIKKPVKGTLDLEGVLDSIYVFS